MRVPWLQVSTQFFRFAARSAATSLGVSRGVVMDAVLCLWEWALSRLDDTALDVEAAALVASTVGGGHDAAAREIAAACEWQGDAAALVEALSGRHVRVLERTEDGFRVRGLDRYVDMAEKQRATRARDAATKAVERAGWQKTERGQWTDPEGKVWRDVVTAQAAIKADPARYDLRKRKRPATLPKPPPPAATIPPPASEPTTAPTGNVVAASTAPLFPVAPPAPAPVEAPAKAKRAPTPRGDARHSPLFRAMDAAYVEVLPGEKWDTLGNMGGREAKAVSALLAKADATPQTAGEHAPAEVLRRWRNALADPFSRVRYAHLLVERWGTYATARSAGPAASGTFGQASDLRRAAIRAETQHHAPESGPVQLS